MSSKRPEVLLVEDERGLADLFTKWLEFDYIVHTAYDGKSAVERIGPHLDVILLDRRMPGVTGDEVLTEIRESGLDCPVAMVTAVEPDFNIVEMGFDDYIKKPINEFELKSLVEKLLELETFDDAVQQFYQLASKKAALEASKSPAELECSDEYASLVAELEAARAKTDQAFKSHGDDDNFEQLLGSI